MEKVILFTHSQDIDGIGNIILTKLSSFGNIVTCVPCETFEITNEVSKYFEYGRLYSYDYIFITDLCIKEPLLSLIDNNEKLKGKIQILDHHKTEIEEGNDKYAFVNIIVEKDGIKESGTSLFYKYLIKHRLIERSSFLDEFVELTRQYDVWDWKKTNNQKARGLNILFETMGIDYYINKIIELSKEKTLEFDKECNNIIKEYNNKLLNNLNEVYKTYMEFYINIEGVKYNMGYIENPYYLRNEIPDYISLKHNIDVVMMNILDKDTISYRSINQNIDCSVIAKYFGGKGHKNAASSPKSNKTLEDFLKEEKLCYKQ